MSSSLYHSVTSVEVWKKEGLESGQTDRCQHAASSLRDHRYISSKGRGGGNCGRIGGGFHTCQPSDLREGL